MSSTECDDLVANYLDICNQALEFNRDRFPFKQIFDAAEKSKRGAVIELKVTDASPMVSYAMTLGRDGIVAEPCACNCGHDREWPVSMSYLESVINNPDMHIKNPAKIDWEWMYGLLV